MEVTHNSCREKPNKMQQCIKILLFPILRFGRHTAHYQEPKTAQSASGFAYVEGCRTCNSACCCTSDNLSRMQIQRLLVQF